MLQSALLIAVAAAAAPGLPEPLTLARYRVLPGEHRGKQPFDVVHFTYGPRPAGDRWTWELAVLPTEGAEAKPLFRLRCVTSADPLAGSGGAIEFLSYRLAIADSNRAVEYRDKHTGAALLPPWAEFRRYFVPRPVHGTGRRHGVPHTCEYLGHVLTLRSTEAAPGWEAWSETTV